MTNRGAIIFIVAWSLFVAGCASPKQKEVAKHSDWKKASYWGEATRMRDLAKLTASNGPTAGTMLVWKPFPDANNPLHRQIWNALWDKGEIGWEKGEVGFGAGRICNYYDSYLVTVWKPETGLDSFFSYFYDPKSHVISKADEYSAFSLYQGNLSATLSNSVTVVRYALAVEGWGFDATFVDDANGIPHTAFTKGNPNLSFKGWLLSKGIVITPPTLIRRNEHAELLGLSEYNVFVYMPPGGQLFRYEVLCRDGNIVDLRRFLIGCDVGDASYQF